MTLESLVGTVANQAAITALLSRIGRGDTVLFAGAGVSMPAGFPSWSDLLKALEGVCDSVGGGFVRDERARRDDPLVYVDAIKSHVEACRGTLDRYAGELYRIFSAAPQIQPFHEDLVALPFRAFMTTNYEPTIETALASTEFEPSEKSVVIGLDYRTHALAYIRSLITPQKGRLVAHLHGWFKQPESIVLSLSDYERAYGLGRPGQVTPLLDFLNTAVPPVSLVFIGFSFEDPSFGAFLAATGDRFATWGSPIHYALIGTSQADARRDVARAAQYKEHYSVETVFYEKRGQSHQHLYEMIAEFRDGIGITKRRPAVVDFNDRMVEGMRG
ncbi:MAG: SIR2 family protein [Gemmatimonadetes bacterium]|nr:SIR2 family protein [Gemmatimonadota bacterium]